MENHLTSSVHHSVLLKSPHSTNPCSEMTVSLQTPRCYVVFPCFSHTPSTGMKNPPLRYRSIQFLICHLKVPGRPPPNARATAWDILRQYRICQKKGVFKNWGRQIAKIENLEEIGIQDPCLKIIQCPNEFVTQFGYQHYIVLIDVFSALNHTTYSKLVSQN